MNLHKRILSAILLIVLLAACLPAYAESSFSAYVKSGSMKVYRDMELKDYWATLEKRTIVTVSAYSGGVARISLNGNTGYAAVSDLARVDSIAEQAEATCDSYVFAKADKDSRRVKVEKGTEVYVLATKDGWAMVEKGGKVGYMAAKHLSISGLSDDEAFEEAVKEQFKQDAKKEPAKEPEKEPAKPMTMEQAFASGKYSNEELCYAYAVKVMGYNSAAAAGLLANIQAESGFRVNANGDSGRSYGICQWFSARKTRLLSWCEMKGYDPATLYAQLQFLHYELETYYPKVDRYMKNVADTADGAYDAAYYFCYNFEAPANKASRSESRGNSARSSFYPKYATA